MARVRELENIRQFLTGQGLTIVLDVAFAVRDDLVPRHELHGLLAVVLYRDVVREQPLAVVRIGLLRHEARPDQDPDAPGRGVAHIRPACRRAASDIRSCVQGGSNTSWMSASVIPGMPRTLLLAS